jgi:hypothetical protein
MGNKRPVVVASALVSFGVTFVLGWVLVRRAGQSLGPSWQEWRDANLMGGRWAPHIRIAVFVATLVGLIGFGAPPVLRAALLGAVFGLCMPFLFGGGRRYAHARSLAALLVLFAVMAFPAQAAADIRFRGESGQDRLVTLRTGDDGIVERWGIRWRARCERPRFVFVSGTKNLPPLDASTRERFADADTYRERLRNGARAVFNARVAGNRVSERRWRGIFRVRVRVLRGGRVIDRCYLRTRWRVLRRS